MFHIHCDFRSEPVPGLLQLLRSLGFYDDHFLTGVVGSYVPDLHYTVKLSDLESYRFTWNKVMEYLIAYPDQRPNGYIEGERIAKYIFLGPQLTGQLTIPPFELTLGALDPGIFRASEIHVGGLIDGLFDPSVNESFSQMGFYPAKCPAPDGKLEQIWTIQAKTKGQIRQIFQPMVNFLQLIGGYKECEILLETVEDFWLSDPNTPRAPIIESVTWN